jgi:hypothetical protein
MVFRSNSYLIAETTLSQNQGDIQANNTSAIRQS